MFVIVPVVVYMMNVRAIRQRMSNHFFDQHFMRGQATFLSVVYETIFRNERLSRSQHSNPQIAGAVVFFFRHIHSEYPAACASR